MINTAYATATMTRVGGLVITECDTDGKRRMQTLIKKSIFTILNVESASSVKRWPT